MMEKQKELDRKALKRLKRILVGHCLWDTSDDKEYKADSALFTRDISRVAAMMVRFAKDIGK